DTNGLRDYVKIMVNGRSIAFLNGINTLLQDGDVVAIFPPVAGG
ncbi:MAG TPA: molybdopterin synthase sulfur carrier subunit, partial [Methanosarcinales archaeon]|nr:molybdopterin synthase sulfur carrier subunit [Methanosarcinales archaeon]